MHVRRSQNDRAVRGGSVQGFAGSHPGLRRRGGTNGAASRGGAGESFLLMDTCKPLKHSGPLILKHILKYLFIVLSLSTLISRGPS